MRKLISSAFVSLDGIMQTPGGPDEDTTSEFTLGGWMFNVTVDSMGNWQPCCINLASNRHPQTCWFINN
jgi:hypothetical protein